MIGACVPLEGKGRSLCGTRSTHCNDFLVESKCRDNVSLDDDASPGDARVSIVVIVRLDF